MWLEAIRGAEDNSSECPTCGGHVRRRVFGEMYAGSYVLDGRRVEIRKLPASGYIDPVSLDARTQYFNGKLYRLWPSSVYFRNQRWLHREVWEYAFGKTPAGCHIHHKNGNAGDNRLENLECIPAEEHLRAAARKRQVDGSLLPPGFKARAAAAEWHRSEAGREWHRQHAIRSKAWTKWKRVDAPCEHCGKVFPRLARANGKAQRYCGPNCKAKAFTKRNPGYSSRYSSKRHG